jgi:hypothetical protein
VLQRGMKGPNLCCRSDDVFVCVCVFGCRSDDVFVCVCVCVFVRVCVCVLSVAAGYERAKLVLQVSSPAGILECGGVRHGWVSTEGILAKSSNSQKYSIYVDLCIVNALGH